MHVSVIVEGRSKSAGQAMIIIYRFLLHIVFKGCKVQPQLTLLKVSD